MDALEEIDRLTLLMAELSRPAPAPREPAPQKMPPASRLLAGFVVQPPEDVARLRAQQITALEADPLFDAEWYLQRHADVAQSGMRAIDHYLQAGAFEGRNPGPEFDTMAYYRANPDVARAGWPALAHYLIYGRAAGRPLAPQS
ncbi:MAG: hypothetical protein ACU0FO_09235 [Pseudooceanicola nanhaiensis]|uniref:hypothetical protein n=1 Tax=Pseudooceanicola nanhaiensis TaxID=375761 RepID=UPI0040587B8E